MSNVKTNIRVKRVARLDTKKHTIDSQADIDSHSNTLPNMSNSNGNTRVKRIAVLEKHTIDSQSDVASKSNIPPKVSAGPGGRPQTNVPRPIVSVCVVDKYVKWEITNSIMKRFLKISDWFNDNGIKCLNGNDGDNHPFLGFMSVELTDLQFSSLTSVVIVRGSGSDFIKKRSLIKSLFSMGFQTIQIRGGRRITFMRERWNTMGHRLQKKANGPVPVLMIV